MLRRWHLAGVAGGSCRAGAAPCWPFPSSTYLSFSCASCLQSVLCALVCSSEPLRRRWNRSESCAGRGLQGHVTLFPQGERAVPAGMGSLGVVLPTQNDPALGLKAAKPWEGLCFL